MTRIARLIPWVLAVVLLGLPLAAQEQVVPEPAEETLTPDSQASYEHGLRLYRNRDFQAALTAFMEVAQTEPDRADIHYLMGYCHLMLKEYEQALDAFQRSFETDPEFDPRTIYKKD